MNEVKKRGREADTKLLKDRERERRKWRETETQRETETETERRRERKSWTSKIKRAASSHVEE